MVNKYTPLIFFGLTIVSIIVAVILYVSFDVPDIYAYLALGVAGISFVITIGSILSKPSQRQLREQKQKNRSVVLRETQKLPPLTQAQIRRNVERGFYDPYAKQRYLRDIRRV